MSALFDTVTSVRGRAFEVKETAMTLAERALRLNYASRYAERNLPALILMSDEQRLPDPREAAGCLPAGSAVLIRHTDRRARRDLASATAAVCRAHGLMLIVSDDLELARAVGAGGLHLPERIAASSEARTIRRHWRGLLTCAAHGPRALCRAAQIGADAALLSPVFASRSHPGRAPLGALRFVTLARAAAVPVYALGGMSAANAGRIADRNIAGIAGIGGLA